MESIIAEGTGGQGQGDRHLNCTPIVRHNQLTIGGAVFNDKLSFRNQIGSC
jgi:hypothetical protein